MKRNVKIIGISLDNEEALTKTITELADKHSLYVPFPFISDTEAVALSKYGFLSPESEKKEMQKGMYLIRNGKICYVMLFPRGCKINFEAIVNTIDDILSAAFKYDDSEMSDRDEKESPLLSSADFTEDEKTDTEDEREKQISKQLQSLTPVSQRVKRVTVTQVGQVKFRKEEVERFVQVLEKVPTLKKEVYKETLDVFLGKVAVDTLISKLKLPSRGHAVNVLSFLLREGVIAPVYNEVSHRKKFRDDFKCYQLLKRSEEPHKNPFRGWNTMLRLDNSYISPQPFVSLLHVSVEKVDHLVDRNDHFVNGHAYFWELMVGKDILHSRTVESPKLFTPSSPFCATFPVFYSQQLLNISLVERKKFQRTKAKRLECSVELDKLVPELSHTMWLDLIDRSTLSDMGRVRVTLKQNFLHQTRDFGTHPAPWFFPEQMRIADPVTLAKRTQRKLKKRHMGFHEPNHRCCVDFVVLENSTEDVELEGWFKYGPSAAPSGLTVEIFLQEPDTYLYRGKWTSYGTAETKKGKVNLKVPRSAVKGRTRVQMVVLNDFTVARGTVWVLPRGVEAVVFDLDGTISVHDLELIKALVVEPLKIHYDGEERNGARLVANQWWALGYLPIYLSGRAGSYYELTLRWLVGLIFP